MTATYEYEKKSDDFLEKLAEDIVTGQVFHSGMFAYEDAHMLAMVFMPLILMEKALLLSMREQKLVFFYEYFSKAGPRSVNGYPMFMSFHVLCIDDAQKLFNKVDDIANMLKSRRTPK